MQSIEKVYGNILTVGRFSLNTLVINGSKNQNNEMRRDAFYYNEFDSKKYSNVGVLNQLNINTNNYFVLMYSGYDENQKFQREEIYMNNKNLENFKEFLFSSYKDISEKIDNIYQNGKINPEYEDYIVQTGYDENGEGFGNIDSLGHTVFIYPAICLTTDGKSTYNGIVFGIETKDGEQFGQEMSLNTFYNIIEVLDKYNLLIDARLVSISGLIYQTLNKTSNTASPISRPHNNTNNNFMKPRTIKKPIQRKPLLSEALKGVNTSETEDKTPAVPIEKPTKTVQPKETNAMSLSDILNEADNVELDLDGDGGIY